MTHKSHPLCEVCGSNPATSFSSLDQGYSGWKYACQCTRDSESYYVEIDLFFASPAETVDWLDHLNQKVDMDWTDFMNMISRYHLSSTGRSRSR